MIGLTANFKQSKSRKILYICNNLLSYEKKKCQNTVNNNTEQENIVKILALTTDYDMKTQQSAL